jgi:hypothetical protein
MTTAEAAQEARRGWLPWLLAPLVLPALGATAVVALVEGVELDSWEVWQAAVVLGALFVIPAAIAGLVARRFGVVEAIAWALACVGIQFVLVFAVGFLALGLGPG